MISLLKAIRRKCMAAGRAIGTTFGFLVRKAHAPALPANPDGKVYVNLGAGRNTSAEFINIDTRTMPNVHYIHEVQKLPMLADDSVDLLYASHLVEHIPRTEIPATMLEWKRVLKPGGVLRFGVPDFDALVKIYGLSGNEVDSIVNQLLGQDAPYDDHHTIWNLAYARKLLEAAGFRNVRLWDAKTADHHAFNDKTLRVVKVGSQDIPISLNVEATK